MAHGFPGHPAAHPRPHRPRSIPRLRRVYVRLEPQFYDKLERLARVTECDVEQLAAQIVRSHLLDSRISEAIL